LGTRRPAGAVFCRASLPSHPRPGKIQWALLAAAMLPVLAVGAQQSSQHAFSVHVETQLVQVHVRIVGRDGKPITGLKKTDFAVKENGKRQQVAILDYVPVPTSVQKSSQKTQLAAASHNLAGQSASHRVWIYIDSEVDSDEVPQAYQAIKQFLLSDLQPGFMVSLDGLPFTDDRTSLLATLEKMRQGPYGHLPDVPPLVNSTLDMEKQADYQWLLYSALLWGGSFAPPPGFASLTMRQGIAQGGRADVNMQQAELNQDMKATEQEMSFYVRTSLFRYLDIIYRLESLQGEKAVVIFRSGLRMDPDSTELLRRLAADAMRHQIVFYTVDTRGLLTIDPSSNRAKLLRYGVPVPTWAVQDSVQFLRALDDYARTDELVRGREEGLTDVAKLTGGKAVTNTNDLHTVFTDVLEDSSGYYVVGFYPADVRQFGRFRQLKISVDMPGAMVYAPKGYYEPLPFKELSKREKQIVLWQALQSEMPRDLPVEASVNVFRGDNGESVAVISTGVRLGALAAKRERNTSEIHLTELAEIGAATGGVPPVYHGQIATVSIANSIFNQASASPTEFVTFNTKLTVAPGMHIFKVVFRDDISGKLGAEKVQFAAADYGAAPSVSTLLVTHHATPISSGNSAGKSNAQASALSGVLQAGQMEFVPQPDRAFHEGDKIYLVYELYNPPSYDFNQLAASARTALMRNGAPIRQFHIDWRVLPDPKNKEAVLIGTLDTSHYEAGDYRVVQSVPVEFGTRGKLFAGFTLLQGQ
jgi:VWFA-related protein